MLSGLQVYHPACCRAVSKATSLTVRSSMVLEEANQEEVEPQRGTQTIASISNEYYGHKIQTKLINFKPTKTTNKRIKHCGATLHHVFRTMSL